MPGADGTLNRAGRRSVRPDGRSAAVTSSLGELVISSLTSVARFRNVVVGAVVTVAGLGGGTALAATTPAVASSAPAASTAVRTTSVTATETEFSIVLSRKVFKAGRYTFKVRNKGMYPHNLVVKGPGVASKKSATLMPGKSGTLTVTLKRGSYELWCSVPGHKDSGMDIKIKVS
jgi:uncharacterized cupredoxin-like copper-binding protein